MTETATFPFDTSLRPPDEVETEPDRRKLLLFVAIGVIVSALVGYFLATQVFGGTDDLGSSGPSAVKRTAPGPLVSGAPLASPAPAPQSFNGAAARNPFVPLVYPPAAAAAAPLAPVAPVAPVAPSAPAPVGQAPTTPGMTTFKVLSVGGSTAVVTIDGVRYTASVGQAFAKTYKLIATSGGVCADFTNAGSKIGLCEGQTLIF